MIRRRLRVQWPSGRGDGTCRHRRANGSLCGAILDARGVGTERVVPQWRRQAADGAVEDASLDVAFRHNDLQLYVDVVVASPVSEDTERARRNASTDGAASHAAEQHKRRRYPYPELTPVAMETLGRLGTVAQWHKRSPDAAPRETPPNVPQR